MRQPRVTRLARGIVVRVVDLFASPLYVEEMFFNVDTIRKECYQRQLNNPGKVNSNVGGWQSKDFHLPDIFFNNLMFGIESAGNRLANSIGIHPCKIDNFWININSKYNLNEKHDHPRCQLSGVYYVKVPSNSGSIQFYHPMDRYITRDWNRSEEYTPYNSSVWGCEPKENDLYIFPSWIEHMVTPNLSDEDRISISFNLVSNIYIN